MSANRDFRIQRYDNLVLTPISLDDVTDLEEGHLVVVPDVVGQRLFVKESDGYYPVIDPEFKLHNASTLTATPQDIYTSFDLTDGCVLNVDAVVVGSGQDKTISAEKIVTVHRLSDDDISILGTVTTVHEQKNDSGLAVDFVIDTDLQVVILQVTGLAEVGINWIARVREVIVNAPR